jgi:hypothetical protein
MRALLDDAHEFEIGEAVPPSFGREAEPTGIPDAELIRLGEILKITWAAERELAASGAISNPSNDELFDKVHDASAKVVDYISSIPARSIEGLRVKSLAVSWCCSGDEFEIGGDSTDTRLAAQICNELFALSGQS